MIGKRNRGSKRLQPRQRRRHHRNRVSHQQQRLCRRSLRLLQSPRRGSSTIAGAPKRNAYQFGAYGAWTNSHFFAQGLATFGWQKLPQQPARRRRSITSNPRWDELRAAARSVICSMSANLRSVPIGGRVSARQGSTATPERRSGAGLERRPANRKR